MTELWDWLLESSPFRPRAYCGRWTTAEIVLHNASDALIGLSYMAIPVLLVYFVRQRRDLPFNSIFLMFGLFIVTCGFTHFMDILLFYVPVYRLAGVVKLATAAASVATVAMLVPVLPRALGFRSPDELAREVRERRRAEEALVRVNHDLEEQVRKRTSELTAVNEALRQEVQVRSATEEDLRRNEQRLRLAVTAAGLGPWHWDMITDHLEFSPRCKELFGISPEEPVDYQLFLKRLHPADREPTDAAVRSALAHKTDYEAEYRVPNSDGSVRWLSSRGRGYTRPDGVLERMEGVVLDVTAQKELESRLRQSAVEMAEEARRRDEFLAMLSHELRNPLAPVRNALQIMRVLEVADARLSWARDVVDRQVEHITRLVDDLLDISRVRAGKIRLHTQDIPLSGVIDRAVEATAHLFQERRHTLNVRLPDEPVTIHGDSTRLTQVFSNLLQNAARYTYECGRVDLTAVVEGGQVVVRVTDNGVGISAELLPHVFDLFRQGNRSLARTEGGLGVGLTLVQRLVEMHGGAVTGRSEGAGKGSEFEVRLPIMKMNAVRPAAKVRVLIVDDNQDAADSLAVLLQGSGFEVATAYGGADGLAAAKEFRPGLVLLDVGLPGLNGYEVARALRKEFGATGVFLAALTGYGSSEDRVQAIEAGFDAHLVKPVEAGVVLALARRVGARDA